MDAVEVGPRSPQEDEFALMALGVPSLYRGFLDPRRLADMGPLLDQGFWSEGGAGSWAEVLAGFLDRCAGQDSRRLVIKSPNHLFRFRSLVQRFPQARCLWILREPGELWASNLRMWRAMTDRYALWRMPPGVLESFLASSLEAFRALLAELRGEGYFQENLVIGYETLVRDPIRALLPLPGMLGLAPDAGQAWLEAVSMRVMKAPQSRTSDLPEGPQEILGNLRELQARILSEAAG